MQLLQPFSVQVIRPVVLGFLSKAIKMDMSTLPAKVEANTAKLGQLSNEVSPVLATILRNGPERIILCRRRVESGR